LPIDSLADQPGVMTSPDAEREGTMVAALQTLHAIEHSGVPWLAIVLRRCVVCQIERWQNTDARS